MIYTHSFFSSPFETSEGEIPILIVENKQEFQKIVYDFYSAKNGIKSCEWFYDNDKKIDLKKDCEIIVDLFDLNKNSTKYLTKLYAELKELTFENQNLSDIHRIIEDVQSFAAKVTFSSDYDLVYDNTLDIVSVFKSMNIRFTDEKLSVIESLIEFLIVQNDLLNRKLIILINCRDYLTANEIQELYKVINYKKIPTFFLESKIMQEEKVEQEVIRVIDRDLCVIY